MIPLIQFGHVGFSFSERRGVRLGGLRRPSNAYRIDRNMLPSLRKIAL